MTSRFRAGDREENQGKLLRFETARKRSVQDQNISISGLICVSTQVIEAGVDVSARRLWSEIAPWPCLVQRLGRMNRDGELNGEALACFWKIPEKRGAEISSPYEPSAVKLGHDIIVKLIAEYKSNNSLSSNAAIAKLHKQDKTNSLIEKAVDPVPEPYPRAIDVHGLFSTEPDVFGGFTDVSPFVRSQDRNADVTVFWRDWSSNSELRRSEKLVGPNFTRDEGCPVNVNRLKKFLDSKKQGWIWDEKREAWEVISSSQICPGMLVMLNRRDGGYSSELGWTGNQVHKIDDTHPPGEPHEKFEDDRFSQSGFWVTLADHLKDTEQEALNIVKEINLNGRIRDAVVFASSQHDIGKALPQWQSDLPKPPLQDGEIWAKAPYQLSVIIEGSDISIIKKIESMLGKSNIKGVLTDPSGQEVSTGGTKYTWHTNSRVSSSDIERIRSISNAKRVWNVAFRPNLRHEAATALALWHSYYKDKKKEVPALAIYLSATHHGKVRTVLSSRTDSGEDVFGVQNTTHTLSLPWQEMPLDFSSAIDGASGYFSEDGTEYFMETTGWTGFVSDLLGSWNPDQNSILNGAVPNDEPRNLGPFVLAYLETLVRCADERASKSPKTKVEVKS